MLHTNIKFLRTSNGLPNQEVSLTQQNFGALFGLTRGMVDSYERNASTPNPETITKIAKHYKISIDDLMTKNFIKNPALVFSAGKREDPKNEINAAKDQLIQEQKQEILFLRNQLTEITKKLNNG